MQHSHIDITRESRGQRTQGGVGRAVCFLSYGGCCAYINSWVMLGLLSNAGLC